MPRTSRASRAKSKTSVRVDLSNISKAFEPNQEYAIRCTEASLEEGQKAPYFNLKLQGIEGGEYENSVMYHRASTGEASLWRLRPLLEAFGFDIPDGPLDIDATDFVDREAMCSTFLDRYDGGSSVKPDEFWPLEDGEGSGDKDDGADNTEFDLDDLSDEEIEALAEELEVKGKTVAAKKKALAKMDQDDVAEAYAGLEKDDEKDEGGEEFDLDELDDDDIMRLAEAAEVTAKTAKRAKAALAKMDQEELAEMWAELGDAGGDGPVTEEAVQDMNEDELEAVVERFELELDLSTYKTLRKMKNAVIDAMEEGGHFD